MLEDFGYLEVLGKFNLRNKETEREEYLDTTQRQYNTHTFTDDAGQSCACRLLGFLNETESLRQDEMPHRKSGLCHRNV